MTNRNLGMKRWQDAYWPSDSIRIFAGLEEMPHLTPELIKA